MYGTVYVFDVPIRSISGTHSMTEEDLGFPAGTMPPEDLATMSSLKVVDKKLLAPIEKLRAQTKRYLSSVGVRVGMGTVVTAPDFQRVKDYLEVLKGEFYAEKTKLLSCFQAELTKRIDENPKFADLIRKYAPDVRNIERRLSYDIDVYNIQVVPSDPNKDALAQTLQRDGNNWSKRILTEVAEFVSSSYEGSIQKSQKLVKQNMGPLRETLLPKIRSFQLLDSSLVAVSAHLESFITDVCAAIDANPKGRAFIDGPELKPFEVRMNQLRSVGAIQALIASSPKQDGFAIVPKEDTKVAVPTAPPAPVSRTLKPRTDQPTRSQDGRAPLVPISF